MEFDIGVSITIIEKTICRHGRMHLRNNLQWKTGIYDNLNYNKFLERVEKRLKSIYLRTENDFAYLLIFFKREIKSVRTQLHQHIAVARVSFNVFRELAFRVT